LLRQTPSLIGGQVAQRIEGRALLVDQLVQAPSVFRAELPDRLAVGRVDLDQDVGIPPYLTLREIPKERLDVASAFEWSRSGDLEILLRQDRACDDCCSA
jgi:hypothetical protein